MTEEESSAEADFSSFIQVLIIKIWMKEFKIINK